MPRSLLPKFLFAALVLALAIICTVALALYSNYTMLAKELVRSGLDQNDEVLKARLEDRAATLMLSLERELDRPIAVEEEDLAELIGDALSEHPELKDLQFIADLELAVPSEPIWDSDRLVVSRAVIYQGERHGQLRGSFRIDGVSRELNTFRGELTDIERRYRARGAIWVSAATLVMLVGCAFLAWLTAIRLIRPITQLTQQAKSISEGNYGSQLPVERDDELGELAQTFNEMREQLLQTTISRDYIDNVLASMNDAVIVTGADNTITRINAATTAMLGYTEDELLGLPVDSVVAETHQEAFRLAELGSRPRESAFQTKGGDTVPVSWTGSVIETENPLFEGRIYAAQNIRERKRAEQRIRYLARMDALTKVPNRMQFQHLLQRAIARARRENHTIALLYIDVDQFKDINDTFGHLAGDAALETLTQRLARQLPEKSVVGRLAGDEFAVILDELSPGQRQRDEVMRLARSALNRLAEPFDVQGHEVFMTASLGIAFYPSDARNVIDLIRNADAALYHAKKAGGNRYEIYRADMNEAAVERLMLKSKLRRSFERNELLLHYQPKYSLLDGRVVGAEALVRWDLPERGLIMPSEFIPLAEETNLIVEIGEWVLERVCADYRDWQQSIADPGRVAINLSLKQLRRTQFVEKTARQFRRAGVSPTSFEFEITETTIMEDPDKTIRTLDELYALGVHLAIDDFGTGYSSLSALQQFPIQTLKIDRSFVRDAAVDADDATIVATIIDMGRSLKMDVVAEGVETTEQLGFLQTLNCNFVQGLLFGEPMSAQDYRDLLLAQEEGTNQHRALFA
ncbi:MAG: EAL domain-containing protein [Pseudomonadota bacterium]